MRRAFCLQGIMYGKAMVMKTRTAAAARLFRGRGLRIAGVFFWVWENRDGEILNRGRSRQGSTIYIIY